MGAGGVEEFIQAKMDQSAAKMKRYNFQDTVSENDNLLLKISLVQKHLQDIST